MRVISIVFIIIFFCSALYSKSEDKYMNYRTKPEFESVVNVSYKIDGISGERQKALNEGWLYRAYADNPALIQKFLDRRFEDYHDLLPWNGEFPGKLLTGGALSYEITGDKKLKEIMLDLAYDYIDTIGDDGYGGCMSESKRFWGWDSWNMYHCTLGLYRWYKITGDKNLLDASMKVADFLADAFNETGKDIKTVYSDPGYEMNQAVVHIMTLLYRETGKERYLDTAKVIIDDFEIPNAGNYFKLALDGVEFYKMPRPRWESLHPIQGIAELYFITGDVRYKTAYTNIWKSIQKTDRHNTGGFSSGEQATGNPYHQAPIETCCTVAWVCLTIDYLRMTGDMKAADELELSYYNGVLGYQQPNGHWYTYNTPMDGEKKSSYQDIVFQARAGAPDLNCCSVNAARGISSMADWGFMTSGSGDFAVNFYGKSKAKLKSRNDKNDVSIKIDSDYPRSGHIKITVESKSENKFSILFRIPTWSEKTTAFMGKGKLTPKAGDYMEINRNWKGETVIDLELDMRNWFWIGENECAGKTSVYRGPVLLAYDDRYNIQKSGDAAPIDFAEFDNVCVDAHVAYPKPIVMLEGRLTDGKEVVLCDFATAGMAGTKYISWLKTENIDMTRADIIEKLTK